MKAAIETIFLSLFILGIDAKKGVEKCTQLSNLKILLMF